MSSTSSTDNLSSRSATDSLARRYRNLFVLPKVSVLIIYGGAACLVLSLLSRGTAGFLSFILAFSVLVFSGLAISSALQIADRKTIATFRRTLALLLGGEILWLIVGVPAAIFSLATGSAQPLSNALLFGAFAAAGFEFLIINGAFEKNIALSFGLALVHPASTLLIIRLNELVGHFDPTVAVLGGLALVFFVAFPVQMKRRRTSLGADALTLFQAFMKTWTAEESGDLERIIADHSEEVEVATKVMRLRTQAGDTFLVLPGVHPGPFHPVGSYDLPGVISRAFKELGPAMTFHRPGGHERNLATKADTQKYALSVFDLAKSITSSGPATVRGPLHSEVGRARVSATSFGNDLVMTMSFAPLGSDDIDTKVETALAETAANSGLNLTVVDAHNSIDPDLQSPVTDDPGWRRTFEEVSKSRPDSASTAYAHSSEVGFGGQEDLTENGIGLLMVQAQGKKSVLVLADANNSVPQLRDQASRALESAGYEMIEFCTSDTHNLAARGLTVERGYRALGEATPTEELTQAVVRMANLAETRLAAVDYGVAEMNGRVRVFGSKALEDFAAITQNSSRFSQRYFRFAASAVAILLFAALIF